MNLKYLHAMPAASLLAHRHQHGALTRRQLLKAGAAAATLAAGSALVHPRAAWAASGIAEPKVTRTAPLAKSPADPQPISYGTPFLFPDPTIFHVQAPGYPLPNPPFDTNPAANDPATITDFNGFVGLGYVGGQGTHHDLVTNQTEEVYWEVDMRFMVGEYVGKDGRHHHATFGFV